MPRHEFHCKAHIHPAIAIRGMVKECGRCKFPLILPGRIGQKKNISASWLSLTQQTSPLSGFIQILKKMALIAGEKSVTDFYEKERKMDK